MSTCLGLFIQNNLIKYAKVSKENENVKIENYGIRFYEQDLSQTIEKIVDETFSYKTPISVNISDEKYTEAEIFGLLSEADQKRSIKTEFEYFYNQIGKNKLTVDYRTVVSELAKDSDKKKVLYAYSEKGAIAEKMQLIDKYRLTNITPVSLTFPELEQGSECIIVNIEDRTEVTTIVNNKPVAVDVIDFGMEEILKNIAKKENSVSKAYEICKNTTLYTESSQNLQTESNDFLELIVPTIYKIMEQVKQVINKNNIYDIKKIYLTGAGVVINNIDLYFQENFLDYKCEILTPYFVDKASLKLNIKDYIEVNSAIALAMQGLNKKNKNISFVSRSEKWDKLSEILNSDVKGIGSKRAKSTKTKNTSINFNVKDINCIRFAYGTFCLLAIYIGITAFLHNRIADKTVETQEVINDTIAKTTSVTEKTARINARTEDYQEILNQLKEAEEQATSAYSSKNAIPNLLSQIMFAIPKEVQVLAVQNTREKHIVIEAQAKEYQYLGYLKSELQNRAILINVTSTSGTRETNGMIKVTIQGDLPY